MMKKTSGYSSVIAVLLVSVFLLVSCATEPESYPDPIVSIPQTEFNIGPEGGMVEIDVDIQNQIDMLEINVAADDEWVEVETGQSMIKVYVESNASYDDRVAELSVYYGEYFEEVISITQSGQVYPDYEITVKDVMATTIVLDVKPSREEYSYMVRAIRKDDLDTYADDDEFFEAELEYVRYMEEEENVTVSSMLYNSAQEDIKLLYLDADTEYVICVYAVSEDFTRLSDVKKSDVVKTDDIEIELEAVAGTSSIKVSMASSDPEAPIFFDIVSAEYLEENNRTLEDAMYWSFYWKFYSGSEIWGRNTLETIALSASYGSAEVELGSYVMDDYFQEVRSDTEFIVWATTVNEYGEPGMAYPDTIHVRTEKAYLSDNELVVTIDNITSTSWDLSVTTTNDDPYVVYWTLGEDMEYFKSLTEEELIYDLCNNHNFMWYTKRGDYSATYGNKEPDTDHLVLVFGMDGGAITTAIQMIDVRTLP